MWLRYNTAVTVKIGPFVDDGDGHTAENALGLAVADVFLAKNGGAQAAKNEATAPGNADAANIGWYNCNLDGTDTNTVGRLVLAVDKAGALPVWHEYMVIPQAVYDSLIAGTDYLQADSMQIEGGDATDAIGDATWDEALAGHVGVGTAGEALGALPDGAAIALAVWAYVTRTLTAGGDASIADAVWDELIADHQNVGSTGEALSETTVAGDAVWDEVIESGAPVNARTARQLLRIIVSSLAGKTAGVSDWSALSLDETKTRIAGTLNASGHRTDITVLDGS